MAWHKPVYFHTPSCQDIRQHCIDHANRYKLVRKDDHKGELSRPSHQKYIYCTVEFKQIRLPAHLVPVAVISKNLGIDSASCSDCNKLHHHELHCAFCKNSSPQTRNPDQHRSENIDSVQSSLQHPCKNLSMHMAPPSYGFLSKSTFINSLRYVVVAPKNASTLIFLRKAARSGACDFGVAVILGV